MELLQEQLICILADVSGEKHLLALFGRQNTTTAWLFGRILSASTNQEDPLNVGMLFVTQQEEELSFLLLTVRADTNQTNCLLESVGTCKSIVSGAALPSGRRCIYIQIMNRSTGNYQSKALPDVYMVCWSWCTL